MKKSEYIGFRISHDLYVRWTVLNNLERGEVSERLRDLIFSDCRDFEPVEMKELKENITETQKAIDEKSKQLSLMKVHLRQITKQMEKEHKERQEENEEKLDLTRRMLNARDV